MSECFRLYELSEDQLKDLSIILMLHRKQLWALVVVRHPGQDVKLRPDPGRVARSAYHRQALMEDAVLYGRILRCAKDRGLNSIFDLLLAG